MAHSKGPYTDILIACADCGGAGFQGWGPVAAPCLTCGTTGMVVIEVSDKPTSYATLSKEEYDELFGRDP